MGRQISFVLRRECALWSFSDSWSLTLACFTMGMLLICCHFDVERASSHFKLHHSFRAYCFSLADHFSSIDNWSKQLSEMQRSRVATKTLLDLRSARCCLLNGALTPCALTVPGLAHARMDLLIFFLKVESNYGEICGLARLRIIKVIKKIR